MLVQLLIKNTTREQREKIVRDSPRVRRRRLRELLGLGIYGAGDPVDMYQPYIDGEKEIDDINRELNPRYLR